MMRRIGEQKGLSYTALLLLLALLTFFSTVTSVLVCTRYLFAGDPILEPRPGIARAFSLTQPAR